jgi:hypothetical protein
MATRIRPKAKNLYNEDFYVWTESQADLLRKRQFDALDLDNLIEEVEALGRAEKSGVLNHASVIIEQLLKLQYSPAQEPRNTWRASVREHRRRLQRDLTPRLRQILSAELSTLYGEIRDDTAARLQDHGEADAANALPADCPDALDPITGDWWPQASRARVASAGPRRQRCAQRTAASQIQPASSRRTRSASSAM